MTKTQLEPQFPDARILELGPGFQPQAHLLWPHNEIEYFDLPADVCGWDYENHDFFKGKKIHRGNAGELSKFVKDKYDIIFASHILEHFPWWATMQVLEEWVECLKPNGALHVLVPALEWVAEEALKEMPSKGLIPFLHGGIAYEGDIHMASFTMRYLRARMEAVGLTVVIARSGEYSIHVVNSNGKEENVECQQHYCVGFKIPENMPRTPPNKE